MFEPMNFINNLHHMGKGMLGIIVVMGVVIVMVALLNKIFSGKNEQ